MQHANEHLNKAEQALAEARASMQPPHSVSPSVEPVLRHLLHAVEHLLAKESV